MPRPTILLIVAGVLALVSVGSPWGIRSDLTYRIGYTGNWCTTAYDADGWAYLDCTYGGTYGYLDHELEAVPGFAGPARLFIVVAIGAVVVGLRMGRRSSVPAQAVRSSPWLQVGLVSAALAPLLTGLRTSPGQLCWWLALALLVIALRTEGRWPFRLRRRPPAVPNPARATH